MSSLRDKIQNEMLSDYSSALEKNFELAKNYFKITKDGKVEILNKEDFILKQQIMLYLVGKNYSQIAGFTDSNKVLNAELESELGISGSTLRPKLMELVKDGKIKKESTSKNVMHFIPENQIEKFLKALSKKNNGT